MDRLELPVAGMKCQKCVARLTAALSEVEGLAEVEVSLERRRASCCYDSGRIDPQGVAAVIEGCGFRVAEEVEESQPEVATPPAETTAERSELRFGIQGMSCANCVLAIEKKLSGLTGVLEARVNLATETGRVDYDPEKIDAPAIFAAVRDAGYTPLEAEQERDGGAEAARELRWLIFSAVLSLPIMPLMWWQPLGRLTLPLVILLATTVQFSAGLAFYRGAWNALRNRTGNMDLLVALGISASWGFSVLTLFLDLGPAFFETGALLVTFIRFGKWLEARAKGRASQALRGLLQLQADRARLLVDGEEREVDAGRIVVGDLMVVRPGDTIPVDGEIVEGSAAIDEALVTGESVPVDKGPGDQVIGATINRTGRLVVRATRVGKETVLARIVQLVEEAQADKAPIQRLADAVSAVFVPVVVAISLLTFIGWLTLSGEGGLFAFKVAVAVLVIACPCALGLATPTAIMVGTSIGLHSGILFKRASMLEQVSHLRVLLLDKTGTLTRGEFAVVATAPAGGVEAARLLELAASAEQHSNHPLARAVCAAAEQRGLQPQPVAELQEHGGKGISCSLDGKTLLVGNARFLTDQAVDPAAAEKLSGETSQPGSQILVALDGVLQGCLVLADQLQLGAGETIRALQQLGLKTVMVTGDRREVATAVAAELGIDEVRAEVLPEDKLQVVRDYQVEGGLVGMVGDGINDAPALAQADIGIAIGSGTDVARETGDIVLVGSDLRGVVRAIRLGRKTLTKIKQNLFWAFVYNLVGIPIAAGLLYPAFGVLLKPELAGLAMAFSSVSVVSNSLLLKRQEQKLK